MVHDLETMKRINDSAVQARSEPNVKLGDLAGIWKDDPPANLRDPDPDEQAAEIERLKQQVETLRSSHEVLLALTRKACLPLSEADKLSHGWVRRLHDLFDHIEEMARDGLIGPSQENKPSSIVEGRLTFSGFSEVNRQRCESSEGFGHTLDSWSVSDWFTATMGELGEAANIAKKLNRCRDGIKGNDTTEQELARKLATELADTFIYLDLLFQRCGLSVEQSVTEAFNAKSKSLGCPIKVADPDPDDKPVSDETVQHIADLANRSADLIGEKKQLQIRASEQAAEINRLQAFKDYVHNRLDSFAVPENPDPEKTESTGCRIGQRLSWLFARYNETAESLDQTRDKCNAASAEAERLKNAMKSAELILSEVQEALTKAQDERDGLKTELDRLHEDYDRVRRQVGDVTEAGQRNPATRDEGHAG